MASILTDVICGWWNYQLLNCNFIDGFEEYFEKIEKVWQDCAQHILDAKPNGSSDVLSLELLYTRHTIQYLFCPFGMDNDFLNMTKY